MLQRAEKALSTYSILAIGLGCAVTYFLYGYQFGRSNHTVYLLVALRQSDPSLLSNDWFTTQTLQYHVIFTHVSAMLMRLGIIAPVFAIIYGILVLLFHIAWRGLIKTLGGDDVDYLLSVVLYALCAAGTGLGMYQFFQDSSLLPSNIANIAMLWGIWMWMIGRPRAAGLALGIAGIFHLNHALIGSMMWIVLGAIEWKRSARRDLIIGTLLAIIPSAINIAFAANLKFARSGAMPLKTFIDLYVRLRHPHHYDPSSWPIGIWLAMLLPTIAGLTLLRGRARHIFLFMLAINGIALLGAGMMYWGETLVQMSLYRFSIYAQLLGCIAAAIWMAQSLNHKRATELLAAGGCVAIIAVCIVRGPFFGVFTMSMDDEAYRSLCEWVSRNTPVNTVFLVPPDEESMRLLGRRAIVVNFKAVPQLSAELSVWEKRLCDVLTLNDLTSLPRGYERTLRAMRARYDELTFAQLRAAANMYGARYVVTARRVDDTGATLLFNDVSHKWFLYELHDLPNEQ